MDAKAITLISDQAFPWVVGWALMSARFFGMAMVFPLFSWLNLTQTVRFAFAAAMSAPFAYLAATDQHVGILGLPPWALATLGIKELGLGIAIGLLAGIPFWMMQSAGEVIDTYRGSSAGALFDPSLTTETSELGTAFMITALAAFVWTGGLASFIGVIYQTYALWPPHEMIPALKLDQGMLMAQSIGRLLWGALGMAAPAVICLFAVDFALALSSRSTRQFQVFDLSLGVKNVAFVFLMPLLASAIGAFILREVARVPNVIEVLRQVLP